MVDSLDAALALSGDRLASRRACRSAAESVEWFDERETDGLSVRVRLLNVLCRSDVGPLRPLLLDSIDDVRPRFLDDDDDLTPKSFMVPFDQDEPRIDDRRFDGAWSSSSSSDMLSKPCAAPSSTSPTPSINPLSSLSLRRRKDEPDPPDVCSSSVRSPPGPNFAASRTLLPVESDRVCALGSGSGANLIDDGLPLMVGGGRWVGRPLRSGWGTASMRISSGAGGLDPSEALEPACDRAGRADESAGSDVDGRWTVWLLGELGSELSGLSCRFGRKQVGKWSRDGASSSAAGRQAGALDDGKVVRTRMPPLWGELGA